MSFQPTGSTQSGQYAKICDGHIPDGKSTEKTCFCRKFYTKNMLHAGQTGNTRNTHAPELTPTEMTCSGRKIYGKKKFLNRQTSEYEQTSERF